MQQIKKSKKISDESTLAKTNRNILLPIYPVSPLIFFNQLILYIIYIHIYIYIYIYMYIFYLVYI